MLHTSRDLTLKIKYSYAGHVWEREGGVTLSL